MEIKFNEARLKKAIENFVDYSKTPKYYEDAIQREEHEKKFQDLLSQPFDELVLSELVRALWSMQIWGNKDYVIKTLIERNGLDKLKVEFSKLIDKSRPVEDRYIEFVSSVQKMGTSSVTEILCNLQPEEAGIWNSVARKALAWLEVSDIDTNEWRLDKEEYANFNLIAKALSERLQKKGLKSDLMLVDYFLWETNSSLVSETEIFSKPVTPTKSQSRHEELKSEILSIGGFLGFSVESEKKLSQGCVIDVIWNARIANLGRVSYVFEVQSSGSIDSLILNLQRALIDDTVQKLVIVSDESQLDKIRDEIQALPENFKKRCIFWSDVDVDKTFEHLQEVNKSISLLHLIEE